MRFVHSSVHNVVLLLFISVGYQGKARNTSWIFLSAFVAAEIAFINRRLQQLGNNDAGRGAALLSVNIISNRFYHMPCKADFLRNGKHRRFPLRLRDKLAVYIKRNAFYAAVTVACLNRYLRPGL